MMLWDVQRLEVVVLVFYIWTLHGVESKLPEDRETPVLHLPDRMMRPSPGYEPRERAVNPVSGQALLQFLGSNRSDPLVEQAHDHADRFVQFLGSLTATIRG